MSSRPTAGRSGPRAQGSAAGRRSPWKSRRRAPRGRGDAPSGLAHRSLLAKVHRVMRRPRNVGTGAAIVGLAAGGLLMMRRQRSTAARRESPADLLGPALLDDPIRNKGTAFSAEERRA